MTEMTCPQCGSKYILGLNGTVDGCDDCECITCNELDHSIIEEEDSLTDMEKA